ncbi:magnesium-transporting ATPase (P-type) [Bradyrhizobium elkanii]|nr:magnesium-transporting ATPase (P-type) [Bradyrhizobium elkanii]
MYSGSLVVRGEGTARVTATGQQSEIGKIGVSLGALQAEPPRLQQQTARLVRLCFFGGAAVSIVAVLLYGTLRGDWAFIFAVHVPIAGLALLPLVFGLPLILGPVHIAFLELIIDPVCSLVFEAEREERDIMARPPRRTDSALFTWALVGWSLLQGALIFALVAIPFVIALRIGMPADEARALAFFALIGSIVGLVLVNRSFSASFLSAFLRPNPALAAILLSVAGALATALLWPPASTLFRFGPLHPDDLMIALGPGVAMLVILELLKPLWGRRLRS